MLGLYKGLVGSALSAAGVIGGAVLGARLAPHVLDQGAASPYTPLVALAGAGVLALVFEALASALGDRLRAALPASPLRGLDSLGGLVLGAVLGLGIVWILGAVALQFPGQTRLRQEAQRSRVLQRLNAIVPPATALRALARVDPFPAIVGPRAAVPRPTRAVLETAGVREARASVVRVVGTACGLGVSGSGWVAAPGLVVTNAHVVAGQDDTAVQPLDGGRLEAVAIAFDVRNDVAVLRVAGLDAPPLRSAEPGVGHAVAIVGFPENGPLDARPGRIGRTATVITEDAYGRAPVPRRITSFRGLVRKGNSGGPVVNAGGAVETTVFATRVGGGEGYGVPTDVVRRAVAGAGGPVSTGPCAPS